MKKVLMTFVLMSVVPLACGSENEEHEESLDVAACEHLTGTEVKTVTATASRQGAPAVAADHHRYEIALADVAGGKGGFLSLAVAEAGDLAFFLDAEVPLKLSDAGGSAVSFESSEQSSPDCAAVKGRFVAHLGVGPVYLELGPTAAGTVNLVVEGEHHDHDH